MRLRTSLRDINLKASIHGMSVVDEQRSAGCKLAACFMSHIPKADFAQQDHHTRIWLNARKEKKTKQKFTPVGDHDGSLCMETVAAGGIGYEHQFG